jgi:hypothetical protein
MSGTEAPTKPCDLCGHPARRSRYCGGFICTRCASNHVGLTRCWCGWSLPDRGEPTGATTAALLASPSTTKHR